MFHKYPYILVVLLLQSMFSWFAQSTKAFWEASRKPVKKPVVVMIILLVMH